MTRRAPCRSSTMRGGEARVKSCTSTDPPTPMTTSPPRRAGSRSASWRPRLLLGGGGITERQRFLAALPELEDRERDRPRRDARDAHAPELLADGHLVLLVARDVTQHCLGVAARVVEDHRELEV